MSNQHTNTNSAALIIAQLKRLIEDNKSVDKILFRLHTITKHVVDDVDSANYHVSRMTLDVQFIADALVQYIRTTHADVTYDIQLVEYNVKPITTFPLILIKLDSDIYVVNLMRRVIDRENNTHSTAFLVASLYDYYYNNCTGHPAQLNTKVICTRPNELLVNLDTYDSVTGNLYSQRMAIVHT